MHEKTTKSKIKHRLDGEHVERSIEGKKYILLFELVFE